VTPLNIMHSHAGVSDVLTLHFCLLVPRSCHSKCWLWKVEKIACGMLENASDWDVLFLLSESSQRCIQV